MIKKNPNNLRNTQPNLLYIQNRPYKKWKSVQTFSERPPYPHLTPPKWSHSTTLKNLEFYELLMNENKRKKQKYTTFQESKN